MDEEIPHKRGHQRGVPLRNRYFTVINSFSVRTVADKHSLNLLRIITSTADELSGGTNIDDLERPCTPKMWVLSDFFAILGCDANLE